MNENLANVSSTDSDSGAADNFPDTDDVVTPKLKKKLKIVLDKVDEPKNDNEPTIIIGREKQFKQLNNILSSQSLPGVLFLWGATSSGKSHTLEKALKKDIHVIRIHSSEILCGRRAFYETFVKQLVSKSNSLSSNFKCDSLQSLFSNVYDYLRENETNRSLRVVCIIEGAENLRGEYDDILRFLVSLQDITQACICVALLSTLPLGQFMPNIMDHFIVPIYFPQYTADELTSILIQQNIPQFSNSRNNSYEFYVKMIVSLFYYICRDLRKLLRLAKSHWKNFQEMVECSAEVNLNKLWKQLEPQLRAQFFELNSSVTSVDTSDQNVSGKTMEMPLNAKYLLIASYLATHNPPASDKRFFVKSKVSQVKKSRKTVKTDTSSQKSFARSFELNRLSAIFGSIQSYCDDKAVNKNRNVSFMTLLTTLCQNKLIQHLGEDSFGNQKYKCLIDYDTVLEISRSVNFELNNYLFRLV